MKKGLLFIILVYTTTVIAQKPSIGVHAGITLASQRLKSGSESETLDHKIGFTAGAMLDLPLASGLSIQPALNFVQKGGKVNKGLYEETTTLNYLELPVNILYNINAGPGKAFVGVGPSVAFALSGKFKTEFQGTTNEEDLEFGSDEDQLNRVDFGINFLAGYRFNPGVVVTANFTHGLTNLVNYNDDVTIKNRYFGFTIGYFFNR